MATPFNQGTGGLPTADEVYMAQKGITPEQLAAEYDEYLKSRPDPGLPVPPKAPETVKAETPDKVSQPKPVEITPTIAPPLQPAAVAAAPVETAKPPETVKDKQLAQEVLVREKMTQAGAAEAEILAELQRARKSWVGSLVDTFAAASMYAVESPIAGPGEAINAIRGAAGAPPLFSDDMLYPAHRGYKALSQAIGEYTGTPDADELGDLIPTRVGGIIDTAAAAAVSTATMVPKLYRLATDTPEGQAAKMPWAGEEAIYKLLGLPSEDNYAEKAAKVTAEIRKDLEDPSYVLDLYTDPVRGNTLVDMDKIYARFARRYIEHFPDDRTYTAEESQQMREAAKEYAQIQTLKYAQTGMGLPLVWRNEEEMIDWIMKFPVFMRGWLATLLPSNSVTQEGDVVRTKWDEIGAVAPTINWFDQNTSMTGTAAVMMKGERPGSREAIELMRESYDITDAYEPYAQRMEKSGFVGPAAAHFLSGFSVATVILADGVFDPVFRGIAVPIKGAKLALKMRQGYHAVKVAEALYEAKKIIESGGSLVDAQKLVAAVDKGAADLMVPAAAAQLQRELVEGSESNALKAASSVDSALREFEEAYKNAELRKQGVEVEFNRLETDAAKAEKLSEKLEAKEEKLVDAYQDYVVERLEAKRDINVLEAELVRTTADVKATVAALTAYREWEKELRARHGNNFDPAKVPDIDTWMAGYAREYTAAQTAYAKAAEREAKNVPKHQKKYDDMVEAAGLAEMKQQELKAKLEAISALDLRIKEEDEAVEAIAAQRAALRAAGVPEIEIDATLANETPRVYDNSQWSKWLKTGTMDEPTVAPSAVDEVPVAEVIDEAPVIDEVTEKLERPEAAQAVEAAPVDPEPAVPPAGASPAEAPTISKPAQPKVAANEIVRQLEIEHEKRILRRTIDRQTDKDLSELEADLGVNSSLHAIAKLENNPNADILGEKPIEFQALGGDETPGSNTSIYVTAANGNVSKWKIEKGKAKFITASEEFKSKDIKKETQKVAERAYKSGKTASPWTRDGFDADYALQEFIDNNPDRLDIQELRAAIKDPRAKEYGALAQAQRGEPEEVMQTITSQPGIGGPLAYVLEHGGDVMHRMNEWFTKGSGGFSADNALLGRDFAIDKVRNVVYYLSRKGPESKTFAQEYDDMISSGAQTTGRNEAVFAEAVSRELLEYAEAHGRLNAKTEPQLLAKQGAVALGNRNWPQAESAYRELLALMENDDAYLKAMGIEDKPTPKAVEPPQEEYVGPSPQKLLNDIFGDGAPAVTEASDELKTLGAAYFTPEALAKAESQATRTGFSIVEMTPEQFISMAQKGLDDVKSALTDYVLEDGKKYDDVPQLAGIIDDDGVLHIQGHDGRHRSQSIADAGGAKFPVILKILNDKPLSEAKILVSEDNPALRMTVPRELPKPGIEAAAETVAETVAETAAPVANYTFDAAKAAKVPTTPAFAKMFDVETVQEILQEHVADGNTIVWLTPEKVRALVVEATESRFVEQYAQDLVAELNEGTKLDGVVELDVRRTPGGFQVKPSRDMSEVDPGILSNEQVRALDHLSKQGIDDFKQPIPVVIVGIKPEEFFGAYGQKIIRKYGDEGRKPYETVITGQQVSGAVKAKTETPVIPQAGWAPVHIASNPNNVNSPSDWFTVTHADGTTSKWARGVNTPLTMFEATDINGKRIDASWTPTERKKITKAFNELLESDNAEWGTKPAPKAPTIKAASTPDVPSPPRAEARVDQPQPIKVTDAPATPEPAKISAPSAQSTVTPETISAAKAAPATLATPAAPTPAAKALPSVKATAVDNTAKRAQEARRRSLAAAQKARQAERASLRLDKARLVDEANEIKETITKLNPPKPKEVLRQLDAINLYRKMKKDAGEAFYAKVMEGYTRHTEAKAAASAKQQFKAIVKLKAAESKERGRLLKLYDNVAADIEKGKGNVTKLTERLIDIQERLQSLDDTRELINYHTNLAENKAAFGQRARGDIAKMLGNMGDDFIKFKNGDPTPDTVRTAFLLNSSLTAQRGTWVSALGKMISNTLRLVANPMDYRVGAMSEDISDITRRFGNLVAGFEDAVSEHIRTSKGNVLDNLIQFIDGPAQGSHKWLLADDTASWWSTAKSNITAARKYLESQSDLKKAQDASDDFIKLWDSPADLAKRRSEAEKQFIKEQKAGLHVGDSIDTFVDDHLQTNLRKLAVEKEAKKNRVQAVASNDPGLRSGSLIDGYENPGLEALAFAWLPSGVSTLDKSARLKLIKHAAGLLATDIGFHDFMLEMKKFTSNDAIFGDIDTRVDKVYNIAARSVGYAVMFDRAVKSVATAGMRISPEQAQSMAALASNRLDDILDFDAAIKGWVAMGIPFNQTTEAIQFMKKTERDLAAYNGEYVPHSVMKHMRDTMSDFVKDSNARNPDAWNNVPRAAYIMAQRYMRLMSRSMTTGLFLPTPKYWITQASSNSASVMVQQGFKPALSVAREGIISSLPFFNRIFAPGIEAARDLAARKGKWPLPTIVDSFNDNLTSAILHQRDMTVNLKNEGPVSARSLYSEAQEEGIFINYISEEMNASQMQALGSNDNRLMRLITGIEFAEHANLAETRQRVNLYVQLRASGMTRREASKATREALYDWKHGTIQAEWMSIARWVPFARFTELSYRQTINMMLEPFVNPDKVMREGSKMGRSRAMHFGARSITKAWAEDPESDDPERNEREYLAGLLNGGAYTNQKPLKFIDGISDRDRIDYAAVGRNGDVAVSPMIGTNNEWDFMASVLAVPMAVLCSGIAAASGGEVNGKRAVDMMFAPLKDIAPLPYEVLRAQENDYYTRADYGLYRTMQLLDLGNGYDNDNDPSKYAYKQVKDDGTFEYKVYAPAAAIVKTIPAIGVQLPMWIDALGGASLASNSIDRGEYAAGIGRMVGWLSGIYKPAVTSVDRELQKLKLEVNSDASSATRGTKLE